MINLKGAGVAAILAPSFELKESFSKNNDRKLSLIQRKVNMLKEIRY